MSAKTSGPVDRSLSACTTKLQLGLALVCTLGIGCAPAPTVVKTQPADQVALPVGRTSATENVPSDVDSETSVAEPVTNPEDAQPHSPPPDQVALEGAESTAEPPSDDVVKVDDPLIPAERVLLLTDVGPLLIDLHLTIDGLPYLASFDGVVDDIMKIADEDEDGRVGWTEIMNHPRFRDGQFGNPATTTYQAQQDMIRQYDTTQNDRVDRDELVRYLSGGQGTSRSLALYTSNYRRQQNRDESAVRKWLDVNDNLVLDATEIENAGRRIRLRDTNDDDVLVASDFLDSAAMQNGMAPRRRLRDSSYLPKVGWLIGKNTVWSDIRVAWNDLYAYGQTVRADDLRIGDVLFTSLDIDKNGTLDDVEMELLAEIDADLALDVELIAGEDGSSSVSVAALRIQDDHLDALVQHQPNRITLQLPFTTIDIFAADNVGRQQYDVQARDLLRRGDGDQNDYLDADEFDAIAPALNVSFESIDVDGNEKVFQDELLTILGQRDLIRRNQLSVRADDQDDALFPTLDLNYDGRIDSREMSEVGQSLLTLDENEDGALQLHELRGSMMIGVVRGARQGAIMAGDSTFSVPTVIRKASESTPRWFLGMDRNRDQGISWREFVGTRLQFEELDINGDGFVVLEEISRRE